MHFASCLCLDHSQVPLGTIADEKAASCHAMDAWAAEKNGRSGNNFGFRLVRVLVKGK
jgi:hypothetical protein